MAAAPWYLLSAGAVVLAIGLILAGARRSSAETFIDPRMDDDEIAERLQRAKGDPVVKLVLLAGLVMMAVSIVWRMARVLF
jgi:hypothetical protein